MTWTPVQKLSIGAGAALLVLTLFGVVAFVAVDGLATQRAEVAEANEVIGSLDQLLAASSEAERAGTDFMMTGAQGSRDAFDQARSRVEESHDVLRVRSEDNPRERAALDSLDQLLGRRFTTLAAGISARTRKGAGAALEFAKADSGRATRGGVLPLVQRMREEEVRVLGERMRVQTANGRTASMVILLGSLLAFALAALALAPIKPGMAARLTRRLTTPMGMPTIPDLGESLADVARQAADRLVRLEQVAYVLDNPGNAEAIGDALLTRGVSGIPAASSIVCNFDGSAWHVLARRGTKVAVGSTLLADLARPLQDAVRSREPIVVETKAEREKLYPALQALGVTAEAAFIAVPLSAGGQAFGGMMLAFDGARVFSDDERAYLATLGRIAGHTLQNMRRREDEKTSE